MRGERKFVAAVKTNPHDPEAAKMIVRTEYETPMAGTRSTSPDAVKSVDSNAAAADKNSAPVPKWLLALLSVAILCLGLTTAIHTARTVYRTYSPVIWWDQWEAVNDLMTTNGKFPPLSMLWSQHSEHRPLVGKLACFADLSFFGGKNVSLLIEIYLVRVASALLFIWMFHLFRKGSIEVLLTVSGLFLFCTLSPLQIENFVWGYQITFVFAAFGAIAAFAAMVCYSANFSTSTTAKNATLLLLSFSAAFLAECSLAVGVFVWPILFLLTLALKLPLRIRLLTATVGVAAIALYLLGYHSPPAHSSPANSILHPLSVWKYLVTYFGWSWDPALPSLNAWPTFSELVTTLAIGGSVAGIIWTFLRPRSKPDLLRAFLAANMLFALIAAVLTSLGRLDFGIVQAISSRYQTMALFFWASLGAFALVSLGSVHARIFVTLEIQALLLILMIAAISRFSAADEWAQSRQLSLSRAYSFLADGPDDPAILDGLKPLHPDPQQVLQWYAFLRSRNLGQDAQEFASKRPSVALPGWGGYRVVEKTRCSGFFDVFQRVTGKRVLTQGWAWDVAARRHPSKIVFALHGGLVVGFGEVYLQRLDVQTIMKIPDPLTGWSGEASAPHNAQLGAYALLADSTSICPLGDERNIP